MAVTPKLCVLTIHGIGFQQPPDDHHAEYADTLSAGQAKPAPQARDRPRESVQDGPD